MLIVGITHLGKNNSKQAGQSQTGSKNKNKSVPLFSPTTFQPLNYPRLKTKTSSSFAVKIEEFS